jgi:hypothetical protein
VFFDDEVEEQKEVERSPENEDNADTRDRRDRSRSPNRRWSQPGQRGGGPGRRNFRGSGQRRFFDDKDAPPPPPEFKVIHHNSSPNWTRTRKTLGGYGPTWISMGTQEEKPVLRNRAISILKKLWQTSLQDCEFS